MQSDLIRSDQITTTKDKKRKKKRMLCVTGQDYWMVLNMIVVRTKNKK